MSHKVSPFETDAKIERGMSLKTPEEALRVSVDALGGLKDVGTQFRPEFDPAIAGQWLAHCLTAKCRDKLSLGQIVYIFRNARNIGEHAGFQAFAAACGYDATPTTQAAELAELTHKADAAVRAAQEAAHDLTLLINNPALLARMKAAGLKVEEL